MSYKVTRFEVNHQGKPIAVAVHAVTDGEETNHIVSIDDHENFEIRWSKDNQWIADSGTGIHEELLGLITGNYQAP